MAGVDNQNNNPTTTAGTAETTANEDGRTMNDSTADEALLLAIDGPSGTGKSTVSRAVAEHLGAKYLDTGAMYRVATLWVLRRGIDPADEDAVVAATADLPLTISDDPRSTEVILDGEDVSGEIRGPEVTLSTGRPPQESRNPRSAIRSGVLFFQAQSQ